jgi:glycosyltransferase involved in cell wall biosynthesis
MALIAVDMTPVLPGGENGGVKLLALELVKGFQAISRDNRFLILTASWNDKELACLESSNTQRLCVIEKQDPKAVRSLPVPRRVERGLRRIYRSVRRHYREKLHRHGPLSARGVDLLFCPFTAPTFAEPGIPVVSLICDLQHKEYPQFFTPQEINTRESFYTEVCRRADAVICISDSTRGSVIRHLKTDPEKTHTVPICIQSRLAGGDSSRMSEHLRDLHIDGTPYLFYPANFWPHKNHRMLLTAYGMYVSRHPESEMDLVFTGALDEAQKVLKDKVRRMGLEKRIHFLGYLPEDQLTALWEGCSFLVFPSLYEGFGIPVLEAMQFGKPVICSNVTSLPEIAGDAALYFDPRKPYEIVNCIERITENTDLCSELVNKGYKRLSCFQAKDMVDKYLKHFEDILKNPRKINDEIRGVYASRSWRITTPLRLLSLGFGKIVRAILAISKWLWRAFKCPFKLILARLIRFTIKRSAIKIKAKVFLRKHPRLEAFLRQFASVRGLVPTLKVPESIPEQSHTALMGETVKELSHLTPRARQIYADLKAAIENHQKENR